MMGPRAKIVWDAILKSRRAPLEAALLTQTFASLAREALEDVRREIERWDRYPGVYAWNLPPPPLRLGRDYQGIAHRSFVLDALDANRNEGL